MKIINLTKEYKISKTQKIIALNSISFDLPNKGLIFILGKSGSGKSTLLNILSGLDNFDSGDIYFKRKRFSSFTQNDLDGYRNSYCGIIFQEYNLIPELNVYDNIAVALNLQGEKNVSVNKVLSQVGLEGFENRKVTELSGGQRQRIAIARALIKSPKIIFADEPTGALDEATGNDILNLLKQLSSEKLIIVVSHDTDFATKYGDRIIHLSDGNIISDTNSEFSSNTDSESFSVKKPHLPFKTALRIGCANFKYHPFKLLLTIILSVMSFLLLGISTNIATFNSSKTFSKHLYDTNISYSSIYKCEINQSSENDQSLDKWLGNPQTLSPTSFNNADKHKLESLLDSRVSLIYSADIFSFRKQLTISTSQLNSLISSNTQHHAISSNGYIYIDEETCSKFGLQIIGTLPKNSNEVAINECILNSIMAGTFKEDNREFKILSPNEIIGHKISIAHNTSADSFKIITGVVYTGCSKDCYINHPQETFHDKIFVSNDYFSSYSYGIISLPNSLSDIKTITDKIFNYNNENSYFIFSNNISDGFYTAERTISMMNTNMNLTMLIHI